MPKSVLIEAIAWWPASAAFVIIHCLPFYKVPILHYSNLNVALPYTLNEAKLEIVSFILSCIKFWCILHYVMTLN